jgi:hypothetical protein
MRFGNEVAQLLTHGCSDVGVTADQENGGRQERDWAVAAAEVVRVRDSQGSTMDDSVVAREA